MIDHPELFRVFDAERLRSINNASYVQQNSYSSFHELIIGLATTFAEKAIVAAWNWLVAKWK